MNAFSTGASPSGPGAAVAAPATPASAPGATRAVRTGSPTSDRARARSMEQQSNSWASQARAEAEDGEAMQAAPESSGSMAVEKKVSCLECRASKVKCSGGAVCARCKRLERPCEYRSHKRGRKSDSSKIHRLEMTVSSLTEALREFNSHKAAESGASASLVLPPSPGRLPHRLVSNLSTSSVSPPSPLNRLRDRAKTRSPTLPAPAAPQSRRAEFRPAFLPAAASADHRQSRSSASATPTAEDPDEPDNLGLPTLSNPLKLLAQASDSARDRDLLEAEAGSRTGAALAKCRKRRRTSPQGGEPAGTSPLSEHRRFEEGTAAASSPNLPHDPSPAQTARGQQQHEGQPYRQPAALQKCFGPARGRTYFANGLFVPKLDNEARFDPITQGLLDAAEAGSLFQLFMDQINSPLTLLDPHLHTFDYVRGSSAVLLSSTCWVAAKFRPDCAAIAARLESRIRDVLLPTILLDGYRSAEIAQAFVILATYHPPTNTLAEDRSWSYIGFAIRIASELDMNSGIHALPASRSEDEPLARRLRNRERTWLNLWLSETSLSQHMGRRPTLAIDPVVMGCRHWHLGRFALPEDKAIVAVVQLRLLLSRNIELFDNLDLAVPGGTVGGKLAAHGGRGRMQLDFFRRTFNTDLDTWLATWTDRSRLPAETDAVMAAPAPAAVSTTSAPMAPTQRLKKAKLYYWYARLMLNTLPLKCSHLGHAALLPFYRDALLSSMAYLDLFMETMVPHGLLWGHNSTIVTPTYCAIFALKMVTMAFERDNERGRKNEMAVEVDLDAIIDAEATFAIVERLVRALEEAGSVTAHRQGAAGSYAPYLQTVLQKVRRAAAAARAGAGTASSPASSTELPSASTSGSGPPTASASHLNKRLDPCATARPRLPLLSAASHDAAAVAEPDTFAAPQGISNGHRPVASSNGGSYSADATFFVPPPPNGGEHGRGFGDDAMLQNLLRFQAGPSGVQTVSDAQPSLLDPLQDTSYQGFFNGDLAVLDSFLGESIFGDMSLPF